jgi:DNA polymerase III subunit gamma/tau
MKEKDLTRAPRALYREYRPANFAEVQGQGHITSVLRAAIEKDEIAHAYLFAGGRGTGKTSMARILARAVGTSDEDVYEMDAASNRGIDEIRSLRDGVSTLPFNSRYKFYIIDEAHALTKDAWGAFLKTLEEPPAHAVFVLATTELDRVPETIVSRCQVFQFKKPSHDILKKLVIDVAKKEGATIAPQAAELVALMGQGSFRDTLGILQKVLTVSKDQKLSEDEVAKVVGAPTSEIIRSFLEALASKNIGDALALFHKAAAGGTDALQAVRAVLLLRYAPKMEAALLEQFGEDDVAVFKKLSAREGAAINSSLLSELISAYIEMNRSPSPEIPLELALYRALGEK